MIYNRSSGVAEVGEWLSVYIRRSGSQEVLSQAEGLGLPRDVVISGVRNRLHNTVTATYYLLLNKRRERQEKECVAKPCTSTATVPVDKSSSEYVLNASKRTLECHSFAAMVVLPW